MQLTGEAMASIEIHTAPAGLTLEEVRRAMHNAAEELNRKRALHQASGFANVRASDVLVHPMTRRASIVISYSDHDRKAPRYVRRELRRIVKLGEARLRTRVEHWYFVRGDICMT